MEVKELGGPLSINSTFLWGSTILTIFILFSARTWLLDKSGHFIMKHRGRFSEGFKVPSSKNNSYACKQSSLLVFPHLKSGPNQYAKWTDELGLLYNQIYLWIIGWSLKRIFGCTGWFSHKWQLPRFFPAASILLHCVNDLHCPKESAWITPVVGSWTMSI